MVLPRRNDDRRRRAVARRASAAVRQPSRRDPPQQPARRTSRHPGLSRTGGRLHAERRRLRAGRRPRRAPDEQREPGSGRDRAVDPGSGLGGGRRQGHDPRACPRRDGGDLRPRRAGDLDGRFLSAAARRPVHRLGFAGPGGDRRPVSVRPATRRHGAARAGARAAGAFAGRRRARLRGRREAFLRQRRARRRRSARSGRRDRLSHRPQRRRQEHVARDPVRRDRLRRRQRDAARRAGRIPTAAPSDRRRPGANVPGPQPVSRPQRQRAPRSRAAGSGRARRAAGGLCAPRARARRTQRRVSVAGRPPLARDRHGAVLEPRRSAARRAGGGSRANEANRLAGALRALRDELGCAIVCVEHDMEIVRDLADRVVCLHRGRIISEGTMDAVSADPEVRRAYLGQG